MSTTGPMEVKDTQPGATFRRIREIMAEPYDDMEAPSPWTDEDFREYLRQEPLPPNQSFQLPSEEQPIEPNQLHLNYL